MLGIARGAQAYQQAEQINPLALQQQQQAARTGQIGAANAMAGGMQGIGNAATLASLLRPQGGMNLPTGFNDQGFSQYRTS